MITNPATYSPVKMNNRLPLSIVVTCIALMVVGCSRKSPIAIWIASSGKQYRIVGKDAQYVNGDKGKMLVVRFESKNADNSAVLESEFHDMYMLVFRKMNLRGYTSVGLEAIYTGPPEIGSQRNRGYRSKKSVEEVKKLASGSVK